jgi:hypothetical protein
LLTILVMLGKLLARGAAPPRQDVDRRVDAAKPARRHEPSAAAVVPPSTRAIGVLSPRQPRLAQASPRRSVTTWAMMFAGRSRRQA